MPLDPDKLLRFAIPKGRQTLTARDIAFYGLSIGMGRDPLDRAQLPFVDPSRGPVVMPAMVLVMAHPGFWLSHPDSGVDPAAVLHASQGFEIMGPLPTKGEVESSTRITGLIDKGAGNPALILSDTELISSGAVFARLMRTTFVRGGGGFGGERGAPVAPVPRPEGPADLVIDLPTGREQALLYRLNGDLNPLHSDPEVAARAGFAAPILHGLCTLSVVAHALLRQLCAYRPECLRAMSARFSNPVIPGETIRTEIWKDGSFQARVVEREAIVIDQGRTAILPAAGEPVLTETS
jgi:acyl dehydratase